VGFRDIHVNLQKSKSVRREVPTKANDHSQARPDFPSRAVISTNSPHDIAIDAIKTSSSSRSMIVRR
jgi:hypothetical protein